MRQEDKRLFGQALSEAFVRKYESELKDCTETSQCTDEHLRRMEEIIVQWERDARRRKRRGWITALLLAAALLLGACVVSAYERSKKGEIAESDDHVRVTYADGSAVPVAYVDFDTYTPGYVPEGYVLVEELHLDNSLNYYKWENEQGDFLILSQSWAGCTVYFLDSTRGKVTTISCGGYEVYHRDGQTHTYLWSNGVYSFSLTSSCPLPEDTVRRMIDSVRVEGSEENIPKKFRDLKNLAKK